MIQIINISKSFGAQVVLDNVSFNIGAGEKIGFVGRNGTGKSTLFRMILGEEQPDSGEISIPKNYSIGALEQHISFSQDTILKECAQCLSKEEQYDHYKVEKILFGLGFGKEDLDKHPSSFSGGYQLRINLTKVLLQKSNLLLLDEPTNYLDIIGLRWLKSYLQSFRGEFVLITHDREFMDDVTTHTIGICRHKIKKIKGKTFKYYEQLASEDEIYERTIENQSRERKQMEDFVNRFRAKARKASQAQSRLKKLNKMPQMSDLARDKLLDFDFNYVDCPGKIVMDVKDLSFSYTDDPLIENISFTIGREDRIGIIGKNGKGKSTLLNMLASVLTPDKGSIVSHPKISIGHFAQTNIKKLCENHSIEQEIILSNPLLSSQQARSIAGTMMFEGDDSQKLIKVLSGGERSRVLLGKILAHPANLLLLDEPTNHLDQESVQSLVNGLANYDGAVVLVTHSEMILKSLVNKLVVFNRGKVEFFDGDYDYFLEKIGWEEAIEDSQNVEKKKISKKELKVRRAELITEKSKILRPLKIEIDDLETKICSLEEKLKTNKELLIQASMNGDSQKIKKISVEIKSAEVMVEQLFERLENVSNEHDAKVAEFDLKMALE